MARGNLTVQDNLRRDNTVATPARPSNMISTREVPFQAIVDRYQVLRTIGTGAQGEVKLAMDVKMGHHVAIKFVPSGGSNGALAKKEIDILKSIPTHPSICHVIAISESATDHVVVMELLPTDLYGVLESQPYLNQKDVRRIIRAALEALVHCHKHGVAHRDIKPENILLDSTDVTRANVRVCDFGLASKDITRTICGSAAYAPPEVMVGLQYSGFKADVWSLGVVMYNISTSFCPWNSAHRTDPVFDRFVTAPRDFWEWSVQHSPHCVTNDFAALFTGMCDTNPDTRLTAEQCLQMPYFTSSRNQELA